MIFAGNSILARQSVKWTSTARALQTPGVLTASRRMNSLITARLSPVSDVLDVLELYERFTPNGTPYIVAKAGFLLQAVIMPYDVINAGFVERLQRLARDCAFALDLRRQEEEQAAAREAAGDPAQCAFNVDASTGEVLEDEGEAGEE